MADTCAVAAMVAPVKEMGGGDSVLERMSAHVLAKQRGSNVMLRCDVGIDTIDRIEVLTTTRVLEVGVCAR